MNIFVYHAAENEIASFKSFLYSHIRAVYHNNSKV